MPQSPVFQRVSSIFSFLFMDLLTVARQAPLSMEIPRQECWSGWPFPSSGDLAYLRNASTSLTLLLLLLSRFSRVRLCVIP